MGVEGRGKRLRSWGLGDVGDKPAQDKNRRNTAKGWECHHKRRGDPFGAGGIEGCRLDVCEGWCERIVR